MWASNFIRTGSLEEKDLRVRFNSPLPTATLSYLSSHLCELLIDQLADRMQEKFVTLLDARRILSRD